MFTGIVKELGTVESGRALGRGREVRDRRELRRRALRTVTPSRSTACCLTVTERTDSAFSADVMNQSLGLTSLGALEQGARVNLEPALRAGDALGGHIVQGHVDCTGDVAAVTPDGIATRVPVSVPERYRRYFVEHGSVTVNGVSLTVALLTEDGFEVSLIPETLERTTLGSTQKGDKVNLEFDVIARYVERLLQFGDKEANDE